MENFGSKEWCIWCKSSSMGSVQEMQFVQKPGTEGETVWVCSDACREQVNGAMKLVRRGLPIFIAGLVGMLVCTALGIALGMTVNRHLLAITGLGVLAFGLVLLRYPMVTPQTILLLGLKRGFAVGRVGGIVMAVIGLAVGVGSFFITPKG